MAERRSFVEEIPVWLEVNGARIATWTASPDRLDALGAGRLLADGFIEERSDILDLRLMQESSLAAGISATVAPERQRAGAEHLRLRAAADGVPWRTTAQHQHSANDAARAVPDADACAELFRALFAADEQAGSTGGLHGAALSDGRTLAHHVQEVSRHNAVDKAIGSAVLANAHLPSFGLVLTARVSGEIAWKAARAQLAWIASRSVPTTLALEVSEVCNLPIIARAAGRERVVHRPPSRTRVTP